MRRPSRLVAAAAAVLAAAALTACGSDDDSPSDSGTAFPTMAGKPSTEASTPAASKSASDEDGTKVVEVTMTGSKVEPAPGPVDVKKGTKVKVVVTRDTDGEIHVHGFGDLHAHAKAGKPATLTFVADQQGSYDVEAHDPDRLLFTLRVR